jgi:hypothetical protein
MPLELAIEMDSSIFRKTDKSTVGVLKMEKFQWNAEYTNEFINGMDSLEAKQLFDRIECLIDTDVNSAIAVFNDFVKKQAECMKKTVIIGKRHKYEWFDKECCESRKIVRMRLRHFRKRNTKENRQMYCKLRREYKNLLCRKKRTYNDLLFQKLVSSVDDQQNFWQTMNKISNKRMQPKNEITIEDWYLHFKSILEKRDQNTINQDNTQFETNDDEILDGPITQDEILLAIRKLKLGKSPGPDGLLGEFF